MMGSGQGRSRLEALASGGLRSRLPGRRAAVAAALTCCATIGLAVLWMVDETPVHVASPQLEIGSNMRLPAGMSPEWLVATSLAAVREALGPIAPTGPGMSARSHRYYSPSAARAVEPPARERLEIGLRCRSGLCVYEAARMSGDEVLHRQAILYPEGPLSQWRRSIRSAVNSLYP